MKIYAAPPVRPKHLTDGEYLKALEELNCYTKAQCLALVRLPNITGKELSSIGYPLYSHSHTNKE